MQFALLEDLDGVTRSQDKLPEGEIGDSMRKIRDGKYNEKVVKFIPVETTLNQFDSLTPRDFNRDVMTMLEWSNAVSKGN